MSNQTDSQSYTTGEVEHSSKRIASRTSDVGGIPVARALPTREQRMIGPWCFLDHAGPTLFKEDETGMQVGAHPHTCLQTFTWMISGAVMHRDSIGSEQLIRPGQVNLMTAGHGISHTESSVFQTDADSKNSTNERSLHAAQLWIALPADKASIAPRFDHYPELPVFNQDKVQITVLIGEYAGAKAPTLHFSPIVGVELLFTEQSSVHLALLPTFEYGLFGLEGGFTVNGEAYAQDELAFICQDGSKALTVIAEAGTRLLLIGGEPFAENVTIWWNFVGHSKEYIAAAQQDWHAQDERFGSAPLQEWLTKSIRAKRMDGPPVPW